MADCSIGALGVLDGDKRFAGIVTERDLSWFVAQAKDACSTSVAAIANDFPVVVDGPLDDATAIERMLKARVRHLIVREAGDFRIVSMRDYAGVLPGIEVVPTAADVMTAPAVACRDEAFFEEVAEALADRDISGMPVVNVSGAVVGVISERDLAHALGGPMVRLAVRRHAHGPFLRNLSSVPRGARRAKDVMTSPAVSVEPDSPVPEIARLMRTHQFNRVPVVDGGRLMGVVTRGDVLAAVANMGRGKHASGAAAVLVGSAGLHPASHG
jgi:CBS domain-containing protein